jgi:hypothetical protein
VLEGRLYILLAVPVVPHHMGLQLVLHKNKDKNFIGSS